jgi:hypothetical protein
MGEDGLEVYRSEGGGMKYRKTYLGIEPFGKPAKWFPILRNDQGVSLVVALLILLVLTILGISAISTTTFETNIAGNQRLYNNAFYAADSGIDYFYGMISTYLTTYASNRGATIPQFNSKSSGIDLGGGEFNILPINPATDIKVVDLGPPMRVEFKITSEGVFPNFPVAGRVRIEAVVEGVSQEAPQEYPGGST